MSMQSVRLREKTRPLNATNGALRLPPAPPGWRSAKGAGPLRGEGLPAPGEHIQRLPPAPAGETEGRMEGYAWVGLRPSKKLVNRV
jgi:hypothetical protein